MADYQSISLLSQSVINLLKKNLCPDIIKNENQIGACSPSDTGDYALGVYFYYLKEDHNNMSYDLIPVSDTLRVFPPVMLKVGMMITAYSQATISERANDEYKILGGAIQIFHDNRILDKSMLMGSLKEQKEKISIQYMNLEFEEQVRIWSIFNEPYKMSAFYEISPVSIDSTKSVSSKPVTSVDISVDRKDK